MDFWVRTENQTTEQSVDDSNVTKAEKSKIKSKVKVMLIIFFNVRGIVHSKFLLGGQIINRLVYKEILQRMLRSVREDTSAVVGQIVAPSIRQCTCWQCPEHLAVAGWENHLCTGTTSQFIISCSVWLFLFPKLKVIIKGVRFEGMEVINITTELTDIPEESFQ